MSYDFEYREVKVGEKRQLDDIRYVVCTGGGKHDLSVAFYEGEKKVKEYKGIHEGTFLNFDFSCPAVVVNLSECDDGWRGVWGDRTAFCTIQREDATNLLFIDNSVCMIGDVLVQVGSADGDTFRYTAYEGYSHMRLLVDKMRVVDRSNLDSWKGLSFVYTGGNGEEITISIIDVLEIDKRKYFIYTYNEDTVVQTVASTFEKRIMKNESLAPRHLDFFRHKIGGISLYTVVSYASTGKGNKTHCFTLLDDEGYVYYKYTYQQIMELLPEDIDSLHAVCLVAVDDHIVPSLLFTSKTRQFTHYIEKLPSGKYAFKDLSMYPTTKYLGYPQLDLKLRTRGIKPVKAKVLDVSGENKQAVDNIEGFIKELEGSGEASKGTGKAVEGKAVESGDVEVRAVEVRAVESTPEEDKPFEEERAVINIPKDKETQKLFGAKSISGGSSVTKPKVDTAKSMSDKVDFVLGHEYQHKEYGRIFLVCIKKDQGLAIGYSMHNGKPEHTLNDINLEELSEAV